MFCPTIVGRRVEADALEVALSEASGHLVLVLGEAGVGKSRFVRDARLRALAQGRTVLFGRATDQSAPAPFRPLAEALVSGFSVPPPLDHEELAPFAQVIRRVVPQWRGEEAGAVDEVGLLAFGEAVTRLLLSMDGRRGALLLLEDLQWADPETLGLLDYLGDHLGRTRTVCIATMRTGEGHEIERLGRRLGERRSARMIELGRLRAEEVDDMVAACLDSAEVPGELLRFVRDRSEGVPLIVEELLAGLMNDDALIRDAGGWRVRGELMTRVPVTFAESVGRRLGAFDDAGRLVVEAAAVLGRRFDWALLVATTGLSERAVIDGLRRAVAAQVLVEEAEGFAFRHALSRDAVLDQVSIPYRQRLSAAGVAAIERAHPGFPGMWCTLAASLAEQGHEHGRAVELLLESARRAIDRGAPASAKLLLERARRLAGDDPVVRARIDEAGAQGAALAGEVDRALELGRAVLAAPGEVLDGSRRAALSLILARAALQAGRWASAEEHANNAGRLGQKAGQEALVAASRAVAAQAAMGEGRVGEAVRLAQAALELGRHAAAPASICEALEVLGREARLHDLVEAERWFEEARLVAERHGLALWRARALHELGTIDLFTTLRRDRLEAASVAAIDAGALATLALVDLHLAAMGLAGFEPDAAAAAAERCIDLSRRLGLATLPMALVHLASSFAMAGRTELMEAAAAEALALGPDDPDVLAGIPGRVFAILHIRRGAWTLARECLDDAIGVLRDHPGAWWPFWGLSAMLHAVDDVDGASACAEAASAPGADISINRSRILMARAVLAGRSGDPDKANEFLHRADEAAAASEKAEVWAMLLRLMVAPAAQEDAWGEPVTWARQGLSVFEQRGLAELAGRCRAFIRQAGEPVPRRRHGDEGLPIELIAAGVTGREADVLRLLVAGLSNKAIGGRLHLSHRTIERHVANLMVKTQANDRRGLAALAEQAGLISN